MYTNGLKDRFGSPLASKIDVEKQITGQIYNKVEHESLSLSNASNEAEVNCIAIKSAYLQHNKEFTEFSILPKDSNTDTPLYMYALLENNGAKTVIGLSDEAITWEAGTEAVWKFTNNPITIPDGKNIELFMVTGQSAIPSSGDPTPPGRHIKIHCNSNMSGAGSTRWNTGWTSNRLVYCKFIEKTGQLVSKTYADETYLTQDTSDELYISQTDSTIIRKNNNIETSWLVDCPSIGEFNAISYNTQHIPHNIEISKLTLDMAEANPDTPLYMYACLEQNGTKTVIGLSDEAVTWHDTGLVSWTFKNNIFTIPNGKNLEVYFIENESQVGVNSVSFTKTLKGRYRQSNDIKGSYRWTDGKWYQNRIVYTIFTEANNEYIEEKFLDAKYLTKEDAIRKYATKEENKPYDWTPDWVHAIQSTNTADYTAPTNGWISTTQGAISGDVTINGQLAGYNTTSGSYTMLLREGDQIHFTGGSNFLFAPCNAEQEDWREVKTNYDIWKNAIRYDDNGTPYVQNMWIPVAAEWAENIRIPHYLTITKVEDEKAYNGENFVCNIQSTEIENATFLFYGFNVNGVDTVCPIQTWDSDLNKLKSGGYMFCRSNLNSFTGNLDSLTRGYQMFYNSKLANFSTPMPEVVNGYLMFATNSLTNFNVEELPKLSNGEGMFAYTNISSFTTDMPKLSNAREMFMSTPSLTTFDADLSNLKTGWKMFGEGASAQSKLSTQSIKNIASSIKDIKGMAKNDDSLWKYDTVDTYGTVKPNAGTIGYDYRGILHLTCDSNAENGAASALQTIIGKGWTVYVNGNIYEGGNFTIYDISEANGYAPDASSWCNEILSPNSSILGKLSKVEDGKAYDLSGNFLFNIESDKITNGTRMMYAMEIGEWVDELPLLQNGTEMFNSIVTSKIDCGDTQNLTNGTYMFQNVKRSHNTSKVWNPVEITLNVSKVSNAIEMFADTRNGVKLYSPNGGSGLFSSDFFNNVTDGRYMFANCYGMVNGDGHEVAIGYFGFSSLIDGECMFSNYRCREDYSGNIGHAIIPRYLQNGKSMWSGSNIRKIMDNGGIATACTEFDYACSNCNDLTTAYVNLSNLCSCSNMFYQTSKLEKVAIPFEKITNGYLMFAYSAISSEGLYNLKTESGLKKYESITQGYTNFSSLSDAGGMFQGCKNMRYFKAANNTPVQIGNSNNLALCGSMFANTTGWVYDTSPVINISGTYISNAYHMFANMDCPSMSFIKVTDLGKANYFKNNYIEGGNATKMFRNSSYIHVNVPLTYVTNASEMFAFAKCYQYFGNEMKDGGVCTYLTNASGMFEGCTVPEFCHAESFTEEIKEIFTGWSPSGMARDFNFSHMFMSSGITKMPLNLGAICGRTDMNCDYMFANTYDMTGDITTTSNYLDAASCGYMFKGSSITTVTDFGIARNTSKKVNAECMFALCFDLTSASFTGDGPTNARGMFEGCKSLSRFYANREWKNLNGQKAVGMFIGCNLDENSVDNILNTMLPTVTYDLSYIDITMSPLGCQRALNILGITDSASIPLYRSPSESLHQCYVFHQKWKGWRLRLTRSSQGTGQYDVTRVNGYIPDASSWNANSYKALTNAGLKITSVEDGIAYQE